MEEILKTPNLHKKMVKFTKHALLRARKRKLWKYVNKEYIFFGKSRYGNGQFLPRGKGEAMQMGDCIYILSFKSGIATVVTMYPRSIL